MIYNMLYAINKSDLNSSFLILGKGLLAMVVVVGAVIAVTSLLKVIFKDKNSSENQN